MLNINAQTVGFEIQIKRGYISRADCLSICKTRTTASHVTPHGRFTEGAGEETLDVV